MIDPAKLKEWRALADAAAPGPWHVMRDGFGNKQKAPVVYATDDDLRYVATCADFLLFNGEAKNQEHAAFIAAARTAVPALLDGVERLSAPIPEEAAYRSMSEGKRLVVQLKAALEKRAAECDALKAEVERLREENKVRKFALVNCGAHEAGKMDVGLIACEQCVLALVNERDAIRAKLARATEALTEVKEDFTGPPKMSESVGTMHIRLKRVREIIDAALKETE